MNIEICTVNLRVNNSSFVIFGIYRPHSGTIENFTVSLNNILNNHKVLNKPAFLLGDFNINILNNDNQTEFFINNLYSYHYLPTMTKPTRFSQNSHNPSLLDQIWINRLTGYTSGVLMSDFTDHLPVFLRMPLDHQNESVTEKIKISFRCNNDPNSQNAFRTLLQDFNWDSIKCADVNVYTERFVKTVNDFYCKAFPLKTKFVSSKQFVHPWCNSNIRKLISAKSQYFNLYKHGFISTVENNHFKNKIKSLVRKSKIIYYRKLFQLNRSNIAKTWQAIKSLIGSGFSNKQIRLITMNNIEYTDEQDIANIFNNYFSQMAINSDISLPANNLNPKSFI